MCALLPLLVASALARPAAAGSQPTFVVDSLVDVLDANVGDGVCETAPGNGVCTVRAAIQEAAAFKEGGATVRIPAGTYALTIPRGVSASLEDGDLELLVPLTVQGAGPGATLLDGNDLDTVFFSASPGVVIRDLSVRNGKRIAGGGIVNVSELLLENVEVTGNEADVGGGILNDGTLRLRHCVVRENTGVVQAGGIYNHLGTTHVEDSMILDNTGPRGGGVSNLADLTIERSLILGNRSPGDLFGGGGILSDEGELTVINSSIAVNESEGPGGGIAVAGGSATLIHVLVLLNHADVDGDQPYADDPGGQLGGGIWVDTDASVYLRGSAVAVNDSGSVSDECGPGSILSGDYNLIGSRRECVLGGQTKHVNTKDAIPNLQDEGLASNGGFAWDYEPGPDSLLVDAVPAAICVDELGAPLEVDGRGYARRDGLCDIGPHELSASRAPETILGSELVLNGGRAGNELGRGAASAFVPAPAWLPYWMVEGRPEQVLYGAPDFPTSGQTPPGSGSHFFAGGAIAEASFHQSIDVSGAAAEIDSGTLPFRVSGALGGYLTDGDQAAVFLTFRSAGDVGLGPPVTLTGPTPADRGNETKLIADSEEGVVPVGTRKILVGVQAVATDGAYNDGYADDLSLELPEPSRLSLGLAAIATLAALRRLSRS